MYFPHPHLVTNYPTALTHPTIHPCQCIHMCRFEKFFRGPFWFIWSPPSNRRVWKIDQWLDLKMFKVRFLQNVRSKVSGFHDVCSDFSSCSSSSITSGGGSSSNVYSELEPECPSSLSESSSSELIATNFFFLRRCLPFDSKGPRGGSGELNPGKSAI